MILDNSEEVKKLDKKDVAGSIAKLPDQVEQAWNEAKTAQFPADFKQIDNIVVVGMGGSALGPEVVRDTYKAEIKIPISLVRDYHLPSFAGPSTLVFLSSYSGSTEEVLSAADEAFSKGCKVAGITEGGRLGEILKEKSLPSYIFNPAHNPCGQPRIGLGYSVGGLLGLFKAAGLLSLEDSEVSEVISSLRGLVESYNPSVTAQDNFTKEIAGKLIGFSVAVVGAEHLSGNTHVFANQLNENAKTYSTYHLLSELNHHLLEGLSKPEGLSKNLKFVILESDQYSEKIKKRIQITKDVMEKQKIETISIKFEDGPPLMQAFDALLISSYITFYLGILNGVDPSEIPWVDYFKEQLAKD